MQRAFIKSQKEKTQGNISVISPNKGMKPIAMDSLTVIIKCQRCHPYRCVWCGSVGGQSASVPVCARDQQTA